MTSASWDGRYGIVVASDVAVYEDGPARPTGGAGAMALLISNRPKILISPVRASYIDHQYDFYKPKPGIYQIYPDSEYPVVDGKLSIQSYLKAVQECYLKLREKTKVSDIIEQTDFFCFHCPYYKMVQKAFTALIKTQYPNISPESIGKMFEDKVQPSLFISQRVGNIYTGSLYACLYSLLYKNPQIRDQKGLLFSYGSGLCSSMLQVKIIENPLSQQQIK
jgi:hydroxymethylglutaryl-CoA synthase